jgi:hypothetical protein
MHSSPRHPSGTGSPGTVRRVEPSQALIDLGHGILPSGARVDHENRPVCRFHHLRNAQNPEDEEPPIGRRPPNSELANSERLPTSKPFTDHKSKLTPTALVISPTKLEKPVIATGTRPAMYYHPQLNQWVYFPLIIPMETPQGPRKEGPLKKALNKFTGVEKERRGEEEKELKKGTISKPFGFRKTS